MNADTTTLGVNLDVFHQSNEATEMNEEPPSIVLPLEVLQQLLNKQSVSSIVPDPSIELVTAHKCKLCGRLFEQYNEIVEHLEVGHKDHLSVDQVAPKQSKQEDVNRSHQQLFLCGKCEGRSLVYKSLEKLKQHMINEHCLIDKGGDTATGEHVDENEVFKKLVQNQDKANVKVKCSIRGCSSGFARQDIMLKHLEYHVEGFQKRFKCANCDKLFFTWRGCRSHIWKAHKIDVGLYECPICKLFKCTSTYDLLVHLKSHSTADKFKQFLCAVCGLQLDRIQDLQNHAKAHETKEDWKVNCPKCDRTFANNKYLKRHVQVVHDKYKPFICNICGHKSARKATLFMHLRQHTGEKPYKCDLCEFKTGDHNSFRRHSSRHSGIYKYSCPHCTYATIQSISMKMHVKRKHPGKAGCFSCTLCTFNSVSEKLFQRHMDIHKTQGTESETVLHTSNSINVLAPSVEDEETQTGLFPEHLEDTVDTGGITIPAGVDPLIDSNNCQE